MTTKFFHPKRHPGYSADNSPEWNVIRGREKGYSYLRIGHELQALANINEGRNKDAHKVFSEAAHIAFKKHKAI